MGCALCAGRAVGEVTPALFVTVRIGEQGAAARNVVKRFAATAYGIPLGRLETIQAVVRGGRENVAARLREYVRQGARHLVVRIAALGLDDQAQQMERVADVGRQLRERVADVGESFPAGASGRSARP